MPGYMSPPPLTDKEKKDAPKITPALLKRVMSYLSPYKWYLLLSFLLIVAITVLQLYPSLIIGQMIDKGLYERDLDVLIRLAIYAFLVLLSAAGLGVLRTYITNWISQHIVHDMRNEMFSHLQSMPQSFFASRRQGEILTRMTGDISGVQTVITSVFTGTFSNIITIIVTAVALFQKSWILALVGIILAPLTAIPTHLVGKKRWKYARALQEKYDKSNQIISEDLSVSGGQLVKLFTKEADEFERYSRINKEITDLTVKESVLGRWFWSILRLITGIAPIVIYLFGGVLMIRAGVEISVGDLSVIVALLARLYNPVESLMNVHINFTRSFALFDRIFEYLDLAPEKAIPDNEVAIGKIDGRITFDNVCFGYTEGKQTVKNISFDVLQGKSVALVGASGAGKSTLSMLIPRLYEINEGSILLDGVDIKNIPLKTLRRNIGVVTQDTYLFNATVKENLLFAKADATDDELIEACKKANIHALIESLPNGYDTLVGARGFKLSGGERQRLSIARILLKNPAVLILDEATSALDSVAEKQIQDAIEPLLKGRTSIMIAHRLSTILSADEILVIDDGEIVERGTHEELIKTNGVYRKLYDTQFMKRG